MARDKEYFNKTEFMQMNSEVKSELSKVAKSRNIAKCYILDEALRDYFTQHSIRIEQDRPKYPNL